MLTDNENVRQSSRAHTQMQASSIKVKLREDEIRSAKIREQRERKERERQRENPQKEVTQADRLAEAARIERRNLKSLNRWEESEKKRAEEQTAKLAALKDRSLSGPVVSWWSGRAKWSGPRLTMVGNKEITHVHRISTITDEPKKRGRPPKSSNEQQGALREADMGLRGVSGLGPPREGSLTPAPSDAAATPAPDAVDEPTLEDVNNDTAAASFDKPAVPVTQLREIPFLQDIREYASIQGQPSVPELQPPPHLAPSPLLQQAPISHVPPEPVPIELCTRNLVILDKFDDLSSDGRKDFKFFYNKKATRLAKPDREMCPITSSQARYRDPSTGIPYSSSLAFKKLQELKRHQYTWSSMLDCYVGKTGVVARGVPESFLGAGTPMRDIQGQPYVRPQPFQLPQPPQPPPQPAQPSAVA